MPHSVISLPPSSRHTRLTVVRRGCEWYRIVGVHGEAMYTEPSLRSACSHSSYNLPMLGVERPSPRVLWGVQGGYSLSRKRVSPLLRTLRHAGNKVQSTALPKILPFSKEKRTPLPRRSSYFCESKIYRYFCMPSVARAGSPETEMVNLTPVALLKRSSSFRKSSAAWLHSPPVILNRLSMKMWEIS